ncbi:MAG TPA: MFS transporter [Acidimicrobiales bacterium]|nr:MFS transporter [Acidimicrobiales bacterium]
MKVLRRAGFAPLVFGAAVNAIGSWASLIAMWGFAAYRFHSGPSGIALVGLAWSLPAALLSPVAGVPIDRIGPKRVLLASYVLGSAAALAMATAGSLHQLLMFGAAQGAVEAFARPAADSLAPRLVDDEDLVAANALLGAASQSAILFGPLLAAVAIATAGLRGAFVVDAATFWVGFAVVARLRLSPAPERTVSLGLWHEAAAGLRVARRSPQARFTLAMSAAVFLTWSSFMVIEPLYVRDVLRSSATVFSLLQTAFGVGLLAAGFAVARLGDRVASARSLAMSVLLSGVAAALYVGTRWEAVAFAGVFLWGVDVAFFFAPSRTLLQRATPTDTHGRMLALFNALHSWSDVAVLPVAGALAGIVGPRGVGLAAAGIATAAGLAGIAAGRRQGTAIGSPAPAAA